MSVAGHPITVVGAGVGGLTAALALARRGADVTVLEQSDMITEFGAGLQITPNGAVVLNALGLGAELGRVGDKARSVILRDYRRAGDVMRLDLARFAPDLDYRFVHRADLIDLLAEAVRVAGIRIRLLQRVARVTPGTSARLTMANGDEIDCDLVVAADGLHSRTQAALNTQDAPFFTGQVAWRATVPNRTGRGADAVVHMAPHRHLVSYPLRGGTLLNLVAIEERRVWTDEGWSQRGDPDHLRRVFSDFGPEARALLDAVDTVHLWGLFRHPVARNWSGQGVALVGDAAHPTLPFLAQGANLALEDAWTLAEALDTVPDRQTALEQFQRRRRPRASKVIQAANGNAWKYHLAFPPMRFAAHIALRLAGTVFPQQAVGQFDWLYRHDVTAQIHISSVTQTGT